MKPLTYGLSDMVPHDAVAAWGARAILRNGYLDFPPDRRDMWFENHEVKGEFVDWMESLGMPWLEDKAMNHCRGNIEHLFFHDAAPYHIACNTNASHGYLYVIAWRDAT